MRILSTLAPRVSVRSSVKPQYHLQTRQFCLLKKIQQYFITKPDYKVRFLHPNPTQTTSKPSPKTYEKSGRAVVVLNNTISKDTITSKTSDSTTSDPPESTNTLELELRIDQNFPTIYDTNSEIIVRNYSTSLSELDIPSSRVAKALTISSDDESIGREPVLGRIFCGKIEFIPDNVEKTIKNNEFIVGDRVWGISSTPLGRTYSDYVPVKLRELQHAPSNIPLHYGGIFPIHLLHAYQCILGSRIDLKGMIFGLRNLIGGEILIG